MAQAQVPAYSWLAAHYDRLMGHVHYDAWAYALQRILKRHKKKPRRLLELGAGTCTLAKVLDLPSLEFQVHTDLSLPMLQNAGDGFPLPRAAADACAIPFQPSFDLVLMCYDALNYLPPGLMRQALEEVHRVLLPEGVFLFDITTEENSLEWFEDYCDVLEVDGGMMVRRSDYDSANRVQHNHFDLFVPAGNGQYRREKEHHVQYIYPVATLLLWLEECRFQVLDVLDAHSLKTAGPKSERIHILAQALPPGLR